MNPPTESPTLNVQRDPTLTSKGRRKRSATRERTTQKEEEEGTLNLSRDFTNGNLQFELKKEKVFLYFMTEERNMVML
jgi:hypothetical protein